MRRLLIPALALSVGTLWASDQDEARLRAALEGKFVTVKVDMPASHKGIDLRFDREQPFDVSENASRIREFDVAIREGDRVQVTHVKLKDDMIEFHLAGGGFDWSSDKTTESFSSSSKSSRESDLEKRIKNETDRQKKREMQEELDDLRRQRERRDDRRRREVEEYNREASERDRQKSLRSGSRFNLRFKKNVPPGALTAEGVRDYLTKWAEISGSAGGRTTVERPTTREDDDRLGWLRKGLLRDEVEKRLGRPRRQSACRVSDPDLDCQILTYEADGDVEVTFVEDVLVRFTIRRR